MQGLKNDRGALREVLVDTPRIDDVIEVAGLQAGALRVGRRCERGAVFDQPQGGEPQPSLGQQAVDVLEGQDIGEGIRARARPVQGAWPQ